MAATSASSATLQRTAIAGLAATSSSAAERTVLLDFRQRDGSPRLREGFGGR